MNQSDSTNSRIILVRALGRGDLSFLGRLSGCLAEYQADILDIGQACIHDLLDLSVLARFPAEGLDRFTAALPGLIASGGLELSLETWTEEQYRLWLEDDLRYRHIVTMISRDGEAETLRRVVDTIHEQGFKLETAYRRSARVPLEPTRAPGYRCLEFLISGRELRLESLRSGLFAISSQLPVDIAVQEDNAFYRNRRLIAFDMDSTLIQMEVIDELAALAGRREEVEKLTQASMHGDMDFKDSLTARVALLAGLPESRLTEVADNMPLTKGAERLIQTLKDFGYKVAVISGGFGIFVTRLRDRFNLDYTFSNTLETRDGCLTGRLLGPIIDAEAKASLLAEICDREDLDLNQAIAVGDGANDLPMLHLAGLGIAFHAKPSVRARSRQTISNMGLDSILYLLGFNDRDLKI